MSDEAELLQKTLDERLPGWSRLVCSVVLAGTVVMTAASSMPPFMLANAGLTASWGVAGILAVRHRWAVVVCVAASLLGISLFGWAGVAPFVVVATAIAALYRAPAAYVLAIAYFGAGWLGVAWYGEHHPPDFRMLGHQLFGPSSFMFALGRVIRSSTAAQAKAQSLATQLNAANEVLRRDLLASEALAAAQERTRIARDLHDSLGHCLATAHVQNQIVRKLVAQRDDDPGSLVAIDAAVASTKQAMRELRRCVAVLREPADLPPLRARLRELVDGTAGLVEVRFEVIGSERRLVPAKEFVLYRALQEALTNITKHAHATTAWVELRYRADAVELSVRDDGIGSDDVRLGFGLRGMQERLEAVGGQLRVATEAGRGFHLIATLEEAS